MLSGTKDRLSSITRLLNGTDGLLPLSISIYVFGSFPYSPTPSDIDLLIVYGHPHTAYSIIDFRRKLSSFIARELGLNVDTCCLSQVETEGNSFIADEGCILIAPFPIRNGHIGLGRRPTPRLMDG